MKVSKDKILETNRFFLRCPNEKDLPFIFEASRYEGFTDGMGWEPPTSMEELKAPMERILQKWEEGRAFQFSIIHKQSAQFLGRISIRETDRSSVWNVGFWTHPKHQRQGVMTEALKAILAFGFDSLSASQIEAEYATWNEASKKVLEKVGMKFVKRIEEGLWKNGEWVAENRMAIPKEAWEENG